MEQYQSEQQNGEGGAFHPAAGAESGPDQPQPQPATNPEQSKPHRRIPDQIPGLHPAGVSPFVLKIRGMPFSVRERDVMELFGRAGVVPTAVSLVLNLGGTNRGQPNGEGFVEFDNEASMRSGMTLNKESMGPRYIELFRVSRPEALLHLCFAVGPDGQALLANGPPGRGGGFRGPEPGFGPHGGGGWDGPGPGPGPFGPRGGPGGPRFFDGFGGGGGPPMLPPAGFGGGGGGGFGGGGGGGFGAGDDLDPSRGACTVKIKGLPFRLKYEDVAEFFKSYPIVPDGVVVGRMPDGRDTGEGWVTFATAEDAERAVADKNRANLGSRFVELVTVRGAPATDRALPDGRYVAVLRPGAAGAGGGPPEGAAAGYVTLRIKGLPYRTTDEDVAAFFTGYAFLPETIVVGKFADGRDSGEGLISFISPEEAQRAQRERHRGTIAHSRGTRYLELQLIPSPLGHGIGAAGGAGVPAAAGYHQPGPHPYYPEYPGAAAAGAWGAAPGAYPPAPAEYYAAAPDPAAAAGGYGLPPQPPLPYGAAPGGGYPPHPGAAAGGYAPYGAEYGAAPPPQLLPPPPQDFYGRGPPPGGPWGR